MSAELRPAMRELARIARTLLVHAELPGPIAAAEAELARTHHDPRQYATYLASRPRAAENQAIDLVVGLCRETGARTHVVHHVPSDALPQIAAARAAGLPFSAETCPHYLSFAAEDIADGATAFKCAPPIRERDNRELLWQALRSGVLELVASDHSPCAPALKQQELGDFQAAWGGISGLQLALSVVWTEARARGCSLLDVVRWMCAAPAALAGMSGRKGSLSRRRRRRHRDLPRRPDQHRRARPRAASPQDHALRRPHFVWSCREHLPARRRVWHRGALEELPRPLGQILHRGARMSDTPEWTESLSEKLAGWPRKSRRRGDPLVNDEFFAEKDNLLRAHAPVWKEHEYTDRGKWMDGWETRRRREPGYDWCVVRLGLPGQILGVIVDTAYFRGNYPAECSLEACVVHGSNDLLVCADPHTAGGRSRAAALRRLPRRSQRATPSRSRARPLEHRTSASTSSPTVASPACACTARSAPTGRRRPATAASSTSRRSRTAAGRWPAATCSSARARTCSRQADPSTCRTAGRPAGAADRATTGTTSGSARAGRSGASRSTRPTSVATRPAA